MSRCAAASRTRCIGAGRCSVGRGLGHRERLEHLEVEHRVVERDRDELLRLEAQRAGEVRLRHDRQIDGAHEHPRARDADAHLALAEAQLLPEALDRGGDRGDGR